MRRLLVLATLVAFGGLAPGAEQPADVARVPIRLDAEQQRAIGLTWGTAERRPVEKVIRTVGRLDFDERKLAQVTLKVGGFIEDLYVNYTGQPVRKGDPLFTLYSPELLTAQREYLLARATERRLGGSTLPEARASAASLVRASRERLRLWDLSPQQMRELEESGEAQRTLTIHAPIAGVVIEK
ncbi:MAG TPA: efflux RND transporter periplasmic adaptor subunit, partial [Verrucomicrobiae bacterium]|nr:efflux RND transporter periplasmic adaptor subunit [Verrucomicrobiae bacterium]